MNKEILTKRIRRVATDIADIANDIDNHRSRKAFFIDLIKQRIFELYDLQKELSEMHEAPAPVKQVGYIKSTFATDIPVKTVAEVSPTPAATPTQQTGLFTETTKTPETNKEQTPPPVEPTVHIEEAPEKTEEAIDMAPPVVTPEKETEEPSVEAPVQPPVVLPTAETIDPPKSLEPDYFTLEAIRRKEEQAAPKTELEAEQTIEEQAAAVPEIPTAIEPPIYTPPTPPTPPTPIETETAYESVWLVPLLADYKESKNKQNDITQRLQNTPITNFATAISISQKHEFITELFAGNSDIYKQTLAEVEQRGSVEKALSYLEYEIAEQYQWAKKEKLVASLLFLISRRFI